MGVPNSEVGYTSATTGRGDHEVQDGHVVALDKKKMPCGLEGTVTGCCRFLENSEDNFSIPGMAI
jgi:hypothetical protein